MQHDAWAFIGVFVLIFLLWIATGGPTHPISFSNPTLFAPQELGGGTYLSLPRVPGIGTTKSPSGSGSNKSLPSLTGGVFGNVSPYFGAISMNHYVSGANSSNPRNEYIEIRVNSSATVPVDLTGWTLTSDATGKSSIIPKGTAVPHSGIVNEIQDIVLLPGDRAYVVSGISPIGASFRENKCIGYFSSFQSFYPSLSKNCPDPYRELVTRFGADYIRDTACIDYAKTLARCEVVLSPPLSVSNSCQSFLVKHFNYNGCLDVHGGDDDFDGTIWHVYLGRTTPLWRTRYEVVKLLDSDGKTVDAFSY